MKNISGILLSRLLIPGLLLIQMTSCDKDESEPVADVDGNVYSTVTIGTQVWMAENLKTTRFNDMSGISLVTSNTTWTSTSNPAYCWYNNDTTYKAYYGAIYNWFAVGTGKICPEGWHVPSQDEFKILEMYLGMTQEQADSTGWHGKDQGKKLKSKSGWDNNGNGSNSSGFSAFPGGYRYGASGAFFNMGALSYWWSSTLDNSNLGLYRRLDFDQPKVFTGSVRRQAGKYIRCVKD
jgi:uncharacterized protein (TIGR02145 family)